MARCSASAVSLWLVGRQTSHSERGSHCLWTTDLLPLAAMGLSARRHQLTELVESSRLKVVRPIGIGKRHLQWSSGGGPEACRRGLQASSRGPLKRL